MAFGVRQWISANQLVSLGLALALGLIVATVLAGGAMLQVKQLDSSHLSVTGYAVQQVTSDRVRWHLSLEAQGPNRQAAYKTFMADYDKLVAYLLKNGLTQAELSPETLSVYPEMVRLANGNYGSAVDYYKVTKGISIASNNVAVVEKLAQGIDTLQAQNLNLTAEPVQYFHSKVEGVKLALLGKAMENAKDRAKTMTRSTGNRVGSMVTASSGVFQITAPDSNEVSDWGIYDTSTKVKDVRAVVNTTFVIN
jgi:hypothetical protein